MIAALYPSLPTIGVRGVLLGKGPFSSLLYTVANFVENRPIHENLSTKIKNVSLKNVPANVPKDNPKKKEIGHKEPYYSTKNLIFSLT